MPDALPVIGDVIATAGEAGLAHRKAILGPLSDWLTAEAQSRGFEVSGVRHTIETFAVRHVKKRDGGRNRLRASRRARQRPVCGVG